MGVIQPYCTDEDLVLRASADFVAIVPRDQVLARATDGSFAGDPWTLTSASSNFETAGITPGMVCHLIKPIAVFRPPGDLLAIASSTDGLFLRRKGLEAGAGLPPGGGGTTGVEFAVVSAVPQIRLASYDLNRRFGVDDLVTGRRFSDLWDVAELREATVLLTLIGLYLDASRGTGDVLLAGGGAGSRPDVFLTKSRTLSAELNELLGRVVIHWRSVTPTGPSADNTTKFGCRIVR